PLPYSEHTALRSLNELFRGRDGGQPAERAGAGANRNVNGHASLSGEDVSASIGTPSTTAHGPGTSPSAVPDEWNAYVSADAHEGDDDIQGRERTHVACTSLSILSQRRVLDGLVKLALHGSERDSTFKVWTSMRRAADLCGF
ncbi:hypothetical protein WOLCODRAFT_158612, partial [Wolfiporia cocos MD-104 SS10]